MQEKSFVLVIDDEKNMANEISAILNESGKFKAQACYSGKEAIEKVKSQSFEAVVLDIRMPEISGIAVLDQIKQLDPELQVIMLTAYDEGKLGWEAATKGAFLYLIKPFKSENLIMEVERAVEVTHLLRNDKSKNEAFNRFMGLYESDPDKFYLCKEKLVEEAKKQNKDTFTELSIVEIMRIVNNFR